MRIVAIFSRDFRFLDNALFEGYKDNEIIPLFLLDQFNQTEHGDNIKSLFFQYVTQFSEELKKLKSKLYIIKLEDFGQFLDISRPDSVRHSFDVEPHSIDKINYLKLECEKRKIKFDLINQFLLPYQEQNFKKIYSPFFKKIFLTYLNNNPPKIYSKPNLLFTPTLKIKNTSLPTIVKGNIIKLWFKTEKEVLDSFEEFLTKKLSKYEILRDYPSAGATSGLSIYLRVGAISHRYVYKKALSYPNNQKFISELAWSEFYRIWLYLNPYVKNIEYKESWRKFKWKYDIELFEKWKRAETGYEMVDAGINQLNEEGWMHNRVRMITASFLVKNLMIDWRWGEQFFYKNLVDADMAQNVGNWQWVTGCGLDASPYFRIFNPQLQLKKFDPEKKYISKYLKTQHPKIIDFERSKREFLKQATTLKT